MKMERRAMRRELEWVTLFWWTYRGSSEIRACVWPAGRKFSIRVQPYSNPPWRIKLPSSLHLTVWIFSLVSEICESCQHPRWRTQNFLHIAKFSKVADYRALRLTKRYKFVEFTTGQHRETWINYQPSQNNHPPWLSLKFRLQQPGDIRNIRVKNVRSKGQSAWM